MSSQDDEFQRQADDAQRMADKAWSDTNREAWLRVAQGWLALIKRPAQTAEQNFDANVQDRRTNTSSDKSN